jgi:hypothetical protein
MTGAHVLGSPFSLTVIPGATYGPNCVAFGEATMRSFAGVGVSGRGSTSSVQVFTQPSGGSTFLIVSKDKYHNVRNTGGDLFDVKLVPKSGKVVVSLFSLLLLLLLLLLFTRSLTSTFSNFNPILSFLLCY